MYIGKMKSDCTESIFAALNKGSRWRGNLAPQYTDPRNAKSALQLARLAEDASTLSDEYWHALKPHFESDPALWRECLGQAVRQVGFLHAKSSFPFFVRNLIGLLQAHSVAA